MARLDPRWIVVRYATVCAKPGCRQEVRKGSRAFYYPRHRELYGEPCGHAAAASRDFEACAFDETMGGAR